MTTGQTEVLAQDLLNAIREFEDEFSMMTFDHIADASGKAPIRTGVATEIVLSLRDPWTIRFADEGSEYVSVTGGTFLAFDSVGDPRPVTTNPSLTISQSVSGTLVETGVSGLTPTEAAMLLEFWQAFGLDAANPVTHDKLPATITFSGVTLTLTEDVDGNVTVQRS
jgi:hypothetical protein